VSRGEKKRGATGKGESSGDGREAKDEAKVEIAPSGSKW